MKRLRALYRIHSTLEHRRSAFFSGLRNIGYEVVDRIDDVRSTDILILWNRHPNLEEEAKRFEAAGAHVWVAENGYLGKHYSGQDWVALSVGQHNGAGRWPQGGPERWESFGIKLDPWRRDGRETVLLPQRGIGSAHVRMPNSWPQMKFAELRGLGIEARIRPHPGKMEHAVMLKDDLANARCVYTWGSGAAIKALLWGVPVVHSMADWIGAPAATRREPLAYGDRLPMFHRLAWAMWRHAEIADGTAFRALLDVQ